MTIKVLIKRKVNNQNIGGLELLLNKLRAMAMVQPGYISGESLVSVEEKNLCLVISTWKTLQDWERWFTNHQRMDLQNQIDLLLGAPTHYEVFEHI